MAKFTSFHDYAGCPERIPVDTVYQAPFSVTSETASLRRTSTLNVPTPKDSWLIDSRIGGNLSSPALSELTLLPSFRSSFHHECRYHISSSPNHHNTRLQHKLLQTRPAHPSRSTQVRSNPRKGKSPRWSKLRQLTVSTTYAYARSRINKL